MKVTARIRVTVDVPCDSRWEPNCPVSQVHEQAAKEAKALVEHYLKDSVGRPMPLRVAGPIEVVVVMAEDKR